MKTSSLVWLILSLFITTGLSELEPARPLKKLKAVPFTNVEIEDGFWAPILRREPADADALRELALELARPQIQLSLFSAVGTRINRAYGPILLILLLSWFIKVYSHPTVAQSATDFLMRAHVGPVGGLIVTALVAALMAFAVLAFASSFLARAPLGELQMRPRARRRALWEIFARPYELKKPRMPQKGVGVLTPPPDEH